MTDFPQVSVPPLFLSTLTRWSAGWAMRSTTAAFSVASSAWPVADTVLYIPFTLPWPYLVQRLWWINGSSAGSAHSIGIYSDAGTRIINVDSTTGTGNSLPQYVTAGALLSPGPYYWAYGVNANTANRILGTATTTAPKLRLGGCLMEASAMTLPATMTGVAVASFAFLPLCGMTLTPSGF